MPRIKDLGITGTPLLACWNDGGTSSYCPNTCSAITMGTITEPTDPCEPGSTGVRQTKNSYCGGLTSDAVAQLRNQLQTQIGA